MKLKRRSLLDRACMIITTLCIVEPNWLIFTIREERDFISKMNCEAADTGSDDEPCYTSVKELQQWLAQFAEKNQEHKRKGMVKKAQKENPSQPDPKPDLSISYELQRSKQTRHESKSISSASSHSTSVASPPTPMRTVNGLMNFQPTTDLVVASGPKHALSSARQFNAVLNEEFLSYQEPMATGTPFVVEGILEPDAETQWYASKANEKESIRILAKVDPPAPSSPHSSEYTSTRGGDGSDSDSQSVPYVEAPGDKPPSAHRAIRNKIPLLFCKLRRESKDSPGPKTVMVPNMKAKSVDPTHRLDPSTARSPTRTTGAENDIDDDGSFKFDDYWNDTASESSRHRLRLASPSIQDVSTSLVDVFEKEIQFEKCAHESQLKWLGSDDSGCYRRLGTGASTRGFLYSSPSRSESYDTASSSISSKHSELKAITPPRNEISDKIERFGGRVKAKKLSSIQERMAELESHWAKQKQAEHSKAVKWEALNGAYKRRIYLETKGL